MRFISASEPAIAAFSMPSVFVKLSARSEMRWATPSVALDEPSFAKIAFTASMSPSNMALSLLESKVRMPFIEPAASVP